MSKILFVTTRNILKTSGELRLIKNRTKTLYEKWGITTEFIALCSQDKIKNKNENIGSNSSVEAISVSYFNPISIKQSLKRVREIIVSRLEKGNYKCVVLSGVITYSFLPMIKKMGINIPIIADIHGAAEELVEFKETNLLKRFYKNIMYLSSKNKHKKYLRLFDGSFVVSNALADYLNKQYLSGENFKHHVIPCAIEKMNFDVSSRDNYRQYYREKYGIGTDEILFIYSGGVSPWQCIDKSIEIFDKFQRLNETKVKFLILSHHIDKVKAMVEGYNNIILDSLNADEVKKVLFAGDYAFLIRDNYVTNNVAYPNKFLEYIQSGMKVITTPHVFDIAKQVNDFELGIVIDLEDKEYVTKLSDYINNSVVGDYDKRNKLLQKQSFEETMSSFVNDL